MYLSQFHCNFRQFVKYNIFIHILVRVLYYNTRIISKNMRGRPHIFIAQNALAVVIVMHFAYLTLLNEDIARVISKNMHGRPHISD